MNIPIGSYYALLKNYLRPQWVRVLLLTLALFSSIGLRVANPQIIRRFLDAGQSGADSTQLLYAGALFLGFAVLVQILSVTATYLGEVIGWNATNALRADLALHALKLDMTYHNTKTPGEMIERIDGDVVNLAIFFSQMVIQVIGSLLLMAGIIAVLAWEDWRVGLALAAFSGLTLFALSKTRALAIPYHKAARDAHGDLYGFIEEQLAGSEDIRSSGAVPYSMRGLFKAARRVIDLESKAGLYGVLVWIVWQTFHVLGRAAAFIAGYLLYTNHVITLGTVYLIVYYTENLFGPLARLSQEMEQFQKAAGSIEHLKTLLAITTKIPDTGARTLPQGALALRFDNVTFGYHADGNVLQNLSFDVKPGRVLGVLGRTGSGKTTIARLIFRLYEVTQGRILLGDDVQVKDVPLRQLTERVSMVTQDVQIFRATVRDNLTLFDKNIADARVLAVIKDLGMDTWLARQPKGLDTELESGGKALSAGEAQLLAFARVFLRDPGLVIMDEASSRLDPATEQRIEHAVDVLLGADSSRPAGPQRTAIIIAHRLATVLRADDILILENGGIAEYGPREALQNDPGSRFAALLRTAARGGDRLGVEDREEVREALEVLA